MAYNPTEERFKKYCFNYSKKYYEVCTRKDPQNNEELKTIEEEIKKYFTSEKEKQVFEIFKEWIKASTEDHIKTKTYNEKKIFEDAYFMSNYIYKLRKRK